MSLQRILERLLVKYLSPYVDGLSTDKLKADLWRGNIVLNDLALKKNLFALLGVDTFQLVEGHLGLMELKIPWSAIYSGEISVLVSGVNVKVKTRQTEKNMDEVVDELRRGKSEALKIQVDSILEKMKFEQDDIDGATKNMSFVAKLTRKIVQNIKVQVSDVNCVGVADALELGFALPSFTILSTDKEFREHVTTPQDEKALYKRMLIEKLTLSLDKQLLCEPIGVRVCLAHDENRLSVGVEFSGDSGLRLSRQQYVTLRQEMNRVEVEKESILHTWVPPEVHLTLPSDHRELKDEYSSLLQLKLFAEEGLSTKPVAQAKLDRLAVIEDAVDNFLLSKWQAVEIKKKNEEQQRQAKAKATKQTWIRWFCGPVDDDETGPAANAVRTDEAAQDLLNELNDENKVESVVMPQTMELSFTAPSFEFTLMDEEREVLRISEGKTKLTVHSESKLDHNGLLSPEWSFEICLQKFQMHTLHQLPPVFAFQGDIENGLKLLVQNTLEPDRTVLSVHFQSGNTQSYLKPLIFVPIARFFDVSDLGLVETTRQRQALYLREKLDDALEENEERWTTVKNMLQERSPDCISVQIDIAAPEFTVAHNDGSLTQFGLGRLSVGTPEPCTYHAITLRCSLSDTSIHLTTCAQEVFHVLYPVPIEVVLQVRSDKILSVDVVLSIESIRLNIAPQAARVALALPEVLAGVAQFAVENERRLSKASLEDIQGMKRVGHEAIVSIQDALKERAQQAALQEQHFSLTVKLPLFQLLLLDSVVPVLETKLSLPNIQLQRNTKDGEASLDVSCKKVALEFAFFNPRVGNWEPVVEPWECALTVSKAQAGLDISCRANMPLLVNITPAAAQTLSWFVPNIMSMHSNEVEEAKWRVLNLTQRSVECQFWREGTQVGQMVVGPSERCWVRMDQFVAPTMADHVTLHMDEVASDPLALRMLGTTVVGEIHGTMFTPHPSHKLLLLSFKHTLHNTLDVPLEIGFESASASDLSGRVAPRHFLDVTSEMASGEASKLLLPQEFVSLPHPNVYFRPVGCERWSKRIKRGSPRQVVRILLDADEAYYVRVHWRVQPSGPPFNDEMVRVTILPALLIRNTLPLPIGVSLEQSRKLLLQCEPLSVTPVASFDPAAEISLHLFSTEKEKLLSVGSWVPSDANIIKRVSMPFATDGGHTNVAISLGYTTTISATWMINRSQMDLSFVDSKGRALPQGSDDYEGVLLLPEREFEISNSDGPQTVEIPSHFDIIRWDSSAICARISTMEHHSVLQLLPACVFTNKTTIPLRLRTAEGERGLEALESSIYNGLGASVEFKVADDQPWSSSIRIGEGQAVAGAWAYVVDNCVYTVEICPNEGLMAVNFSSDPTFVFRHCGPSCDVIINGALAQQDTVTGFGWTDPMGTSDNQIKGDVTLNVSGQSIALNVHQKFSKSAVVPGYNLRVIPGRKKGITTEILFEADKWWRPRQVDICVNIALSRLGLSLVSASLMEELFYIQLDLFRGRIQIDGKNDVHVVDLILADCQANCQLASRISCESDDAQKETLFQEQMAGNRAVIFGNTGETEFLTCSFVRVATASRDLVFTKFNLQLSSLETNIDDQVIVSAQEIVAAFTAPSKESQRAMLLRLQSPITNDFVCPPVPTVLQVDDLQLGKVEIAPWLSLSLKNMDFLPEVVKVLLYTVTLSQNLTVECGSVVLDENKVAFRGPASDLAATLAAGYRNSILKSLASLLGCSSLLNVPRVPIQLVQNVGNFSIGTVGTVLGEASSLLGHLTFDAEYVAKQQRLRDRKRITGLGAGFAEGMKSIAGAGAAVFDIFTKPIEGAKKKGIGGFFSGLAKGAIGTVVKPITKLGQATADVTAGVAAAIGTESHQLGVRVPVLLVRSRKPRLLFGELGEVRRWSALEAHVWMNLRALCRGVHCIVPLGKTQPNEKEGPFFAVLLLYSSCMRMAKLPLPTVEESEEGEANLLAALDKTGDTLLSRLVVPLRTVAQTGEMLLSPIIGMFENEPKVPEHILKRIVWSVLYRNIKRYEERLDALIFLDEKANSYSIPSHLLPIVMRKSLVEMILQRRLQWNELNEQLRAHYSKLQDFDEHTVQTSQVVFAYQVQRFNLVHWVTPFLIAEPDKQKVWMDQDMRLHPKLDSKLTVKELVKATEPPLDVGALWTPTSAWQLVLEGDVDEEGWAYAVNWGASVWTAKRGWLDVVRRRLWKRTYK